MIIDVSKELCTLNSYVDIKIPESINLKFPKKSYNFKAIEETKEKVTLNDIMNYNYNEALIYNNIPKNEILYLNFTSFDTQQYAVLLYNIEYEVIKILIIHIIFIN